MYITSSFRESLQHIETIIKPIIYGQQNILGPESIITSDPTNGLLKITNFYRNPDLLDQGTCHELNNAMIAEIQKNRISLYSNIGTVINCTGWDGGRNNIKGFFTPDEIVQGECGHQFLVVSPRQNLILPNEDFGFITQQDALFHKFDTAYIIDPSLKVVKPYYDSGYTINFMSGENVRSPLVTDVVMEAEYDKFPFCITEKGEIYYLINMGNKGGLCICKKIDEKEGFGYQVFSLTSPPNELLAKTGQSRVMYRAIKGLRAKVKTTTNGKIDWSERTCA